MGRLFSLNVTPYVDAASCSMSLDGRTAAVDVGQRLEVGALLGGERRQRFEVLDAEVEDFVEPPLIDPVPRNEYAGLFEPQAQRAHVFSAARNDDAPLPQRPPERREIDLFTGGLHVDQALDEVHPLTVLQNVPGESLMEDSFVAAEAVEDTTGFRKRGVPVPDQAVRPHGELGVVGELAPVVVGRAMTGEVAGANGVLEAVLPVRAMLVRQLQQNRQVDLVGREFTAEGKVAPRHGNRPSKIRAGAPVTGPEAGRRRALPGGHSTRRRTPAGRCRGGRRTRRNRS